MGGTATCDPATTTCAPAAGGPPKPGGLKQVWDLKEPQLGAVGSSEQAKKFAAAFKAAMDPVNKCLQYTKCNAEKEKHDAMVAKRDYQYTNFQSVQGQIDPKDEAKAKEPIQQYLNQAQGVAGEANAFKQATEKSVKAWQAKEPSYTKSDQQIGELEKWGDKEFANLQKSSDGIRSATNVNKYDEAVKLLDEHLPKLKPIHDEYVKQKAAKEKYDAEYKKIDTHLPKTSSGFAKLTTTETDLAEVQKKMEAAVQAKDYVQALELVNSLSVKLPAYTAAIADLKTKKLSYEKAIEGNKLKLNGVTESKSEKLAPQKLEVGSAKTEMEAAATKGDYDEALLLSNKLTKTLDAFESARAELEKQKKAYDDAMVKLKPKLGTVNKTEAEAPALAPLSKEIAGVQTQMEEAVKKEEYKQAESLANNLSTMIDTYKNTKAGSVWVIKYGEKEYQGTAEELAVLKIKIAAHAIKTHFPPLQHRAEYNTKMYRDLVQVRNSYPIIGFVVGTLGGADPQSMAGPVQNQQRPLDEAAKAISTDIKTAQQAYDNAIKAVNAAGEAVSAYMDALDKGGSRTITALDTVKVVCFAVGAAAGAAILLPAAGAGVLATAGANAVAGAGFGALESLANSAGTNLIMTGTKPQTAEEILTNAGKKALTEGAGAAIGSLGGRASGKVCEGIIVKLGVTDAASKKLIAKLVDDGISGQISYLFSNRNDLMKKPWDELVRELVTAFIAGGIGGQVTGKANPNMKSFQLH